MLKIYGTPVSVHTRKVIVAAIAKGIEYEVVPVVPVIPGNPPPNWRQLSATGRIPALADGDFTLARGSTNELQAGDVGAGDEEDNERRSNYQKEAFAKIAHHLVMKRTHNKVPAFVELRVVLREAARNAFQRMALRRTAWPISWASKTSSASWAVTLPGVQRCVSAE